LLSTEIEQNIPAVIIYKKDHPEIFAGADIGLLGLHCKEMANP